MAQADKLLPIVGYSLCNATEESDVTSKSSPVPIDKNPDVDQYKLKLDISETDYCVIRSPSKSERRPLEEETSLADCDTFQHALSPPPRDCEEGHSRSRSWSPFLRFRGNKLSGTTSNETPTSPTEASFSASGKKKLSKKFRKRFARSASSDISESSFVGEDKESAPPLPCTPTAPPLSPTTSTPRSDVTELLSSNSPSGDNTFLRKTSARIVLRVIGRKLFTTKPKLGANPDQPPPNKKPTQSLNKAVASIDRDTFVVQETSSSIKVRSKDEEQQSLPIKEVKPASSSKRFSQSKVMAEVLARSSEPAHTSNQFSSLNPNDSEVTEANVIDYESKTVGELKQLLNRSSNSEERSKIRSVIRNLLLDTEEEGSGENLSRAPEPVAESLKRNRPVVSNRSPLIERKSPATFNVTFNNNNTKKDWTPPWSAEQANKHSFRSVSSVKFDPVAKSTEARSASPITSNLNSTSSKEGNPFVSVTFNSLNLKSGSNLQETPTSRFGKREFSSSFKDHKSSYKTPDCGLRRTESLKLPRDFIRSQSNSAKSYRAQVIETERVVLERVTPQNKKFQVSNKSVSPVDQAKTSASSPAGSSLQRSESCKENQTSPEDHPFIPIVRGNKRRSRGILGRVLGFKIDSEKTVSPPTTQEVPQHPTESSLAAKVVEDSKVESFQTSPVSLEVLSSVPEENAAVTPIESSLEEELVSVKTAESILIENRSSGDFSTKAENVIYTTVDKFVSLVVDEQETTHFTPTEEDLVDKSKETVCSSLSKDSTFIDVIEYLVEQVIENLKESSDNSSEKQTLSEENRSLEEEEISETSGEEEEDCKEHVEVCVTKGSIEIFEKVADQTIVASLSSVYEDIESNFITSQDQSVVGDSNILDNFIPASSSEETKDTVDSSSSHCSSFSGSGEESDQEEEMSGRYSDRSRFGGDGGSIKSRILATEDRKESLSSEKYKKSRQVTDARAFRNAEGVKSRMNKFANVDTSTPTSKMNGSPKINKNGINSTSERSRPIQNGGSEIRRNRRREVEEVEMEMNNNVAKTIISSDARSNKITTITSSDQEALKRLEAASKSVMDDLKTFDPETKTNASTDQVTVEVNMAENSRSITPPVAETHKMPLPHDDSKEVNTTLDTISRDKRTTELEKHAIHDISEVLSNACDVTASSADASDDVTSEAFGKNESTPSKDQVDFVSAFAVTEPSQPSNTLSLEKENKDDVSKEKEPETRYRSRRDRRNNVQAVSESEKNKSISDADQKDKGVTNLESDARDSLAVESSSSGRRRRRRNRKLTDDSSDAASACSSAVSTPDRETAPLPNDDVTIAPTSRDLASVEKPVENVTEVDSVLQVTVTVIDENDKVDSSPCSDEQVDILTTPEVGEAEEIPAILEAGKSEEAPASEKESSELAKTREESGEEAAVKRDDDNDDRDCIKVRRIKSSPAELADTPLKLLTETDQLSKFEASTEETKSEKVEKITEGSTEMRYSLGNLSDVTDEAILKKLLDEAEEYEERKKIRSAIRALRKKGVEEPNKNKAIRRETTRTEVKTTTRINQTRKNGTVDVIKTGVVEISKQRTVDSSLVGAKDRNASDPKLLADKYSFKPSSSPKKDSKEMTSSKKIGSIFDREEEAPKKSGSKLDLERRQAERRREITRNRSMPASSSKDARKMFVAKLESHSEPKGAKKVGRSPTFVVPNANNVKQMLLKWCQAKTRGYDHVDINNFSGSWASGMAFCALVHNFFPQSFDYSELDPKNRAHNFDLAFNMAEKYADAMPLLEVGDMMIMGSRPDSKCVFTYVQSLYNKLRKFEQPLKPLTTIVKVMGREEERGGAEK